MGRKDMGDGGGRREREGEMNAHNFAYAGAWKIGKLNEHLRRENDASRRTPATVPSLHIHGHYDDAGTYKQIFGYANETGINGLTRHGVSTIGGLPSSQGAAI